MRLNAVGLSWSQAEEQCRIMRASVRHTFAEQWGPVTTMSWRKKSSQYSVTNDRARSVEAATARDVDDVTSDSD
jgi:hypothetical protein